MFGKKKKETVELVDSNITEISKTKKKKKKFKKRYIFIGLAVVVVAFLIVNSIFAKDASPVVTVSQALKGDIKAELSTSGLVSSESDKTYYAEVAAPIKALNIKKGDLVKTGDLLVEFDTTDLENTYQQAALKYQGDEAGYKDSLNKASDNSTKLKNSTTDVGVLKQQVSDWTNYCADLQQIANNTNNQISQLQSNLADASTALAAAQTAVPIDTAKVTDLTNSINSYKQQIADLQNYATTAQNKLITAQNELSKYNTELGNQESIKSASETSSMTAEAKAQLKATNEVSELTKEVAAADLETAKKGITADFDGIVTDVQVQNGAYLTKGAPLFTIASSKDVKLSITLTKYDLENAKEGDTAVITFAGKEYTGTLSRISKVAKTNDSKAQVVDADIHIENPDDNLYLGVEAKANVTLAELKGVLQVPIEAVNVDKKGEFCYVVENGVVKRKDIVTGISSDLFTEIKEGLKEGDTVITQSDTDISEGMAVTTMQAEQ